MHRHCSRFAPSFAICFAHALALGLALALVPVHIAAAQTKVFFNGAVDYTYAGSDGAAAEYANDFELPWDTEFNAMEMFLVDWNNAGLANWDETVHWALYESEDLGPPSVLLSSGTGSNVVTEFLQSNEHGSYYRVSFDLGELLAVDGHTRYYVSLRLGSDCESLIQVAFARTVESISFWPYADYFCAGKWVPGMETAFTLLDNRNQVRVLPNADSTCPGNFGFGIIGATPGGRVAVVYSDRSGSFKVPGGLTCGGTIIDMGMPMLPGSPVIVVADECGQVLDLVGDIPDPLCGVVQVQAVDATTCRKSQVLIVN